MALYIPKLGDVVQLNFDPQAGAEITKRRPALVLSPEEFNMRTRFIWVCPITSTPASFPMHVEMPRDLKTKGWIKVEQLRSLDFKARQVAFIEAAPAPLVQQCRALAGRILGF